MINTLAIFMPKEKIGLSCYAVQDYFMLSPYFILQGLVTVNFFEIKILSKIKLNTNRKILKLSIQF